MHVLQTAKLFWNKVTEILPVDILHFKTDQINKFASPPFGYAALIWFRRFTQHCSITTVCVTRTEVALHFQLSCGIVFSQM
jgi:hypothetical protein